MNPDLVVRDKEGEFYTVRYDTGERDAAQRVPQRAPQMQELEAGLEAVSERLKLQEARFQKVSAQLEQAKSTPQMVNNNR